MSVFEEVEAVKLVLRDCTSPVIVDLGAYNGAETALILGGIGDRRARVVLVEADKGNYEIVKQRMGGNGFNAEVSVLYGAISDRNGTCDFWECHSPTGEGSGSIRNPSFHRIRTPQLQWNLVKNVPCFTLDHLYERERLDHIDVLWVDIQGAERDMIAGGGFALARSRYLFIEAEEVAQYEGQAVRTELMELLPAWSLVEQFEYNLLLRNERYYV